MCIVLKYNSLKRAFKGDATGTIAKRKIEKKRNYFSIKGTSTYLENMFVDHAIKLNLSGKLNFPTACIH